MSAIFDRLRSARERSGLTIAELARRAGVPVSTVQGWERRSSGLAVGQVERVCEVLGVSLDWLITGKDAEKLTLRERRVVMFLRELSAENQLRVVDLVESVFEIARQLDAYYAKMSETDNEKEPSQ